MFIRFDTIHERDGRTDGRTHRHRMTAKAVSSLLLTSRGKNQRSTLYGIRPHIEIEWVDK